MMMVTATKTIQVGADPCRDVAAILCKKPWRATERLVLERRFHISTPASHNCVLLFGRVKGAHVCRCVDPADLQAVL